MMLADMDGNTNDPWWTQILSSFKAPGFRQYPLPYSNALEEEGPGFRTTLEFYGIYDPVPSSYLSLHWHISHWLELAGEENKQITRKQT